MKTFVDTLKSPQPKTIWTIDDYVYLKFDTMSMKLATSLTLVKKDR